MEKLLTTLQEKISSQKERFILGIAGIPGSGKSTLSKIISKKLNLIIVPMDGYHTPLKDLKDRNRRGAPWTFDSEEFVSLVNSIKQENVYANSFDHSIGDPKVNDIKVDGNVVVEGNYLLYDEEPWNKLKFDYTVFLECDLEVAKERLVKRHIESGLARNEEEARKRVDDNDMLNAQLILSKRRECDFVLRSEEVDLKLT